MSNKGSQSYIRPAFFESEITMVGTTFFHLGTYYYIDAPTLNLTKNSEWLFLRGYYNVMELTHQYSAGGQYKTIIKGMIQQSTNAAYDHNEGVKTISAADTVGKNITKIKTVGKAALKLF